MVWIKILFPVQAFPLSGYRFPICLCLKYCPQKIICRCDPLRPGTENQATGILEYAYGIALDTSELTTYLQPAALDSRIYSYILTDHGEIAAKIHPH